MYRLTLTSVLFIDIINFFKIKGIVWKLETTSQSEFVVSFNQKMKDEFNCTINSNSSSIEFNSVEDFVEFKLKMT